MVRIGQCKPVRTSGSSVFVIASTIHSIASTSAPVMSSENFATPYRSAVPGSNVTGRATTTTNAPMRRALLSGSVPSHRSPLVRTTAIAAHDSPTMNTARPKVDNAPMSQSRVQSTVRPAPITSGRLTPPGVGTLRAGAACGRGFGEGAVAGLGSMTIVLLAGLAAPALDWAVVDLAPVDGRVGRCDVRLDLAIGRA